MVQFVDRSEEELKFWRIFEALIEQTKIDIQEYYNKAYESKTLGNILYEQQMMPIYKTLEKSLFIKAFSKIIEGERQIGSIEAYLKILYAIFGTEAQITISKENPLHIKIDIVAPVQTRHFWKVRKHNKIIITKDDKFIVFKQLLARVTNRELLQILKSTTKAGTYIEFTLNQEEV